MSESFKRVTHVIFPTFKPKHTITNEHTEYDDAKYTEKNK